MSCISPIYIKNNGAKLVNSFNVPCGRCYNCLRRKAQQWAFRFEKEMDYNTQYAAQFVTLTYSDENLEYLPFSYVPTLNKGTFQKYMKRLRKAERKKGNRLRLIYYAVGEYGTKTRRPHYHYLILNCSMSEKEVKEIWGLGNVLIGTVTGGSVAYVMKYMEKGKEIKSDLYNPPFALMSKKIGLSWLLDDAKESDHKLRDYIVSKKLDTIKHSGYNVVLPRYFKSKMFDKRTIDQMSYIRSEESERRLIEDMKKYNIRSNEMLSYEAAVALTIIRRVSEYRKKVKNRRDKI